MKVIDGWLDSARHVPSPHFNARPEGEAGVIDLLVLHAISLPRCEFGGPWIEALFLGELQGDEHPDFAELRGLEVSSHLLIRRDGELLQFVPFEGRAWHAGVSRFGGREGCNDFAIGIELEGCDEQPFEAVQYRRLAEVSATIRAAYPAITPARIAAHSEIAPGRKTDPGPHFDWHHYFRLMGLDTSTLARRRLNADT